MCNQSHLCGFTGSLLKRAKASQLKKISKTIGMDCTISSLHLFFRFASSAAWVVSHSHFIKNASERSQRVYVVLQVIISADLKDEAVIVIWLFGWNTAPGGSVHALRYLPNIRYGISLFIFVIRYSRKSLPLFITEHSLLVMVFRYSYLVFVFRYSCSLFICVIRRFFFRKTRFCTVTNNESNAITYFARNKKIHLKRMKSLR